MIARGILGDGDMTMRPGAGRYEPDPKDPIFKAIEDKRRQLESERTRVLLAEPLNTILYDDIVFETNRAFGTENTRANYKSDFQKYAEWCRDNKLPSLPTSPEVVAHYLIEMAKDHKPERLARSVAAIAYTHEWSDLPWRDDVVIRAALRGARRCHEQAAAEKAEAQAESPVVEKTELTINGSGGSH